MSSVVIQFFFPLPYRCDFLVLLITVIAQFLELIPALQYATFVRSLKLLRYVQQDAVCNRGCLHDKGYTAIGCYVWSRGTGTQWKPLFCSWDRQLGKYSFTAMTVLHALYQHASLLSNSVALLVVAMYYFFAIIGMEAFRYQVYPQCWYGYIHMHNHAARVSLL